MDGFEVAKRLKEMEETRHIQVVALTCLGDLESKIKGIDLGFDDYLTKPTNAYELKARVNRPYQEKDLSGQASVRVQIRGAFGHHGQTDRAVQLCLLPPFS